MDATACHSTARLVLALGLMLMTGARASADPIYSITDLGEGVAQFSTDAQGNRVVLDSSGRGYAFPNSTFPVPDSMQHGVANIAQPGPSVFPPIYGFSNSYLSSMNGNGLAAGIDTYSTQGHWIDSEAFYVQRQPDGSWSRPFPLWSGGEGNSTSGDYPPGRVVGISNTGQILGVEGLPTDYNRDTHAVVADVNKGITTDLTMLVADQRWPELSKRSGALYPGDRYRFGNFEAAPIGIDAVGRILLAGGGGDYGTTHSLLLTPEGVLSDPIPVPEPTTFAVLAIGFGGLGLLGRVRRRGRGSSSAA